MTDIQKCFNCGIQPEMYGFKDEGAYKIYCIKCDSIVSGTNLDFTIDTWNKLQERHRAKKVTEELYQATISSMRYQPSETPKIYTLTGPAKDNPVKCVACDRYPLLKYHPKKESENFGYYEFYCEICHMSTGRHSTFDFAKQRWDEINASKKEMAIESDALPRCRVCGGHPTVNHYASSFEESYYEVGCKKCQVWAGPKETRSMAEKTWCEMNPENHWLRLQVDKCSKCGTNPDVRWHKSLNGYKVTCLTCKKFVVMEKLKEAICTWNLNNLKWDYNPSHNHGPIIGVPARSGRYPWNLEGPKAYTKPPLAPKPCDIFYEERITELSRAIADRLAWIKELKDNPAKTLYAEDWYKLGEWAKEIVEMAKLRGDIGNG